MTDRPPTDFDTAIERLTAWVRDAGDVLAKHVRGLEAQLRVSESSYDGLIAAYRVDQERLQDSQDQLAAAERVIDAAKAIRAMHELVRQLPERRKVFVAFDRTESEYREKYQNQMGN